MIPKPNSQLWRLFFFFLPKMLGNLENTLVIVSPSGLIGAAPSLPTRLRAELPPPQLRPQVKRAQVRTEVPGTTATPAEVDHSSLLPGPHFFCSRKDPRVAGAGGRSPPRSLLWAEAQSRCQGTPPGPLLGTQGLRTGSPGAATARQVAAAPQL